MRAVQYLFYCKIRTADELVKNMPALLDISGCAVVTVAELEL